MSTGDSNQPHTTLYRSSPTIQALHAVPQALTLYPRWVPVQGRNPSIGGKDWQHRAGTLQHAAIPTLMGWGFTSARMIWACPHRSLSSTSTV